MYFTFWENTIYLLMNQNGLSYPGSADLPRQNSEVLELFIYLCFFFIYQYIYIKELKISPPYPLTKKIARHQIFLVGRIKGTLKKSARVWWTMRWVYDIGIFHGSCSTKNFSAPPDMYEHYFCNICDVYWYRIYSNNVVTFYLKYKHKSDVCSTC